jgi:hypothetical protein
MLLEDEAPSSLFFSISRTGISGFSSAFSVERAYYLAFIYETNVEIITISIGDLSENAEGVKNVDRCHRQVKFHIGISNFIQQL